MGAGALDLILRAPPRGGPANGIAQPVAAWTFRLSQSSPSDLGGTDAALLARPRLLRGGRAAAVGAEDLYLAGVRAAARWTRTSPGTAARRRCALAVSVVRASLARFFAVRLGFFLLGIAADPTQEEDDRSPSFEEASEVIEDGGFYLCSGVGHDGKEQCRFIALCTGAEDESDDGVFWHGEFISSSCPYWQYWMNHPGLDGCVAARHVFHSCAVDRCNVEYRDQDPEGEKSRI